jgi:transposase-like protein
MNNGSKSLWVSNMNCPRCGGEAKATGKQFKFGVFDGKSYSCKACGKPFNAFYRDKEFSHTVPKAK